MPRLRYGRMTVLLWLSFSIACRQGHRQWHDPAKHQVQFVTVEEGVQLEVLDWPGSGRPIVLLAGLGNTAHVFDWFAAQLSGSYHVYGITRRGFGASSQPNFGYTEERLADDILKVLDSLNIVAPVLVGSSVAGNELTAIGSNHSNRLAGLVYMDAAADPTDDYTEYEKLRAKLPDARVPAGFYWPVRLSLAIPEAARRNESIEAFQRWQRRWLGIAYPESELRSTYDIFPDGSLGPCKTSQSVSVAIRAGGRKRDYSRIEVPILAFSWFPPPLEEQFRAYHPNNAEERAAIERAYAADVNFTRRRMQNILAANAPVRVIEMPGANHLMFISNEAEVLQELRAFLVSLH